MTWLSLSHAAALLQISERRLRDRLDEYTIRAAGKAANGKEVKEALLESLPVDAQARFFQSTIEPVSPVAVRSSCDAEGGSEDASSSPGAPAPTPSVTFPSMGEGAMNRAAALASLGEDELARLNGQADILRDVGTQLIAPSDAAARLGMSVSTLKRKIRALKKHGLAGLARKTRADRGRARVADDKVVARIKTEFLQPQRPAARHIFKTITKDYALSGLKPPSYSFVLRKTKEIDPDLVSRFRYGEKEFDDKFALVTLRKKPALPRLWCDADHHQMDHIVLFPDGSIGRPWLTAIQDICTNEILGYMLTKEKRSSYPGATGIGLTLRNAILVKDDPQWPSSGLFQNFYHDLGRDFRGQYVRAVCHDLGINVKPTRGYHGKSKPIERFFGVLENGIKTLAGYIGRSTETNPLHQNVGPSRAWEEMRGEIMTVDQFEAALHKWIVADFHHAESRALRGLSPLGALEMHVKNGWGPKEIHDERALDLLLMHRKAKKVQRFGIEMFGSQGAQRFFMAPELAAIVGQEVEVFYDPAKIGELVIYRGQRFLCKAQNRELLDFGADEETLKRERELKALQRRSIQERIDELAKAAQYPNALARAAAEARREKVMDEDREKMAVNATPAQSVYKLLPKYQLAAKAEKVLARAPRAPAEKTRIVADDLKSSDELFKREDNPWLDEENQ